MSLLKRLNAEPAPPPAAPAPVISMPRQDDSARMLELSLQITDRVLASLGQNAQLDRTPESERMLQERFANYYRQMGATLNEAQIKQLYTMVLTEIFGFGPIQQLL